METGESVTGLSDWMGRLPMELRKRALCHVCIPGSHDSGCFHFRLNMDYAHDQNIMKYLRPFKCKFVKNTVKRWAVTQTLNFADQLQVGIRYFDIRLELTVDPRIGAAVFIVHGLYADEWTGVLNGVINFLSTQQKEVVVLNVSHVYNMGEFDYRRFFLRPLEVIASKYGVGLCNTSVDLKTVSIEQLCKKNMRLIVVGPFDEDIGGCSFRSSSVISKWPRKNKIDKLLKFMQAEIHSPVTPGLHVLQGVITPKFLDILRNWRQSLAKKFSLPARDAIKCWMNDLTADEVSRMNVMLIDQVCPSMCRKVIKLNTTHRPLGGCPDIQHSIEDPEELEPFGVVIPLPFTAPQHQSSPIPEDEVIGGPPQKPNQASFLIDRREQLGQSSSSLNSSDRASLLSGSERSPLAPPKPKRHQLRREYFTVEVDSFSNPNNVPLIFESLSRPTRIAGSPCRIARPVTEEELHRAAIGDFPVFGSIEWFQEREAFERLADIEDAARRERKMAEKRRKAEEMALLVAEMQSSVQIEMLQVVDEVQATEGPVNPLRPVEIEFEYTLAARPAHADVAHIEVIDALSEEVAELAIREALTDGSLTMSSESDEEETVTGSDNEEEPLISTNVSHMVEDLVIHSTLDAMSNLKDRLVNREE